MILLAFVGGALVFMAGVLTGAAMMQIHFNKIMEYGEK